MTRRLYFHDTFLLNARAVVVAVELQDDKRVVVLDQTICHPQGGGQPSDIGQLRLPDGSVVFHVEHVTTDATKQIIHHIGRFAPDTAQFNVGDTVEIEVDAAARLLHARLHSAGHLLDAAMQQAGRKDLEPTKGYHFADGGAYVEYEGEVAAEDREALAETLTVKAQELVNADLPVLVEIKDDPSSGQVLRTVSMGGCSCPCGGTHVQTTGQIKAIKVTKIKKNKKSIRVSYDVCDAS